MFVTTSRKLKRRVQSLRRYAWDVRQLLQELRQNQFGVVATGAREMMESVEGAPRPLPPPRPGRRALSRALRAVNANNMVEVSEAYMQQCLDIEQIFDSHQEKQLGNTLYLLTIATVPILPIQTMTGLFGMNFIREDHDGDPNLPLLRHEVRRPPAAARPCATIR